MIAKELYQKYIGLELLHDLVNDEGTLLLKKGTVLSESLLRRLNVRIEYLNAVCGKSNRPDHLDLIEGASNEIKVIFDKFKKINKLLLKLNQPFSQRFKY
ncbi:hypothetical protein [Halalkalibacter okhensis]|uniref:Uncharacterized protein n=1 Tax=Halalkalibacter okhensis TaxID=333138 RepID=A0A0B0IBU5_9BACI|nr:hypothetical protein [Halalkalibacter okhensis]KHF38760.1 hypothetical protein LQ50_19140 [Halalkalibacter okhensis]